MSRLLGLDVGRKTIGIALSDTGRTIASPLKLITRSKMERDFSEIAALIQQHDISRVVIGLPLHMNGGESEMSHYVRDFGSKLEASLNKERNYPGVGTNSQLPPPGTKGARGGNLSSYPSTNTFPPLNPPLPAVEETSNVHPGKQTWGVTKEQGFIAYWDERLSTAAVFRAITAAEMSFKRRAEVKDKMAASFILQGYLDWLKNN